MSREHIPTLKPCRYHPNVLRTHMMLTTMSSPSHTNRVMIHISFRPVFSPSTLSIHPSIHPFSRCNLTSPIQPIHFKQPIQFVSVIQYPSISSKEHPSISPIHTTLHRHSTQYQKKHIASPLVRLPYPTQESQIRKPESNAPAWEVARLLAHSSCPTIIAHPSNKSPKPAPPTPPIPLDRRPKPPFDINASDHLPEPFINEAISFLSAP